jgi:hypothetical protein
MFPEQQLKGEFRPDVGVAYNDSSASENSCSCEGVSMSHYGQHLSVVSLHLKNWNILFR